VSPKASFTVLACGRDSLWLRWPYRPCALWLAVAWYCKQNLMYLNDVHILHYVDVRQKPLFILSWPPIAQPISNSFPYLVTIVTGWQRGITAISVEHQSFMFQRCPGPGRPASRAGLSQDFCKFRRFGRVKISRNLFFVCFLKLLLFLK